MFIICISILYITFFNTQIPNQKKKKKKKHFKFLFSSLSNTKRKSSEKAVTSERRHAL